MGEFSNQSGIVIMKFDFRQGDPPRCEDTMGHDTQPLTFSLKSIPVIGRAWLWYAVGNLNRQPLVVLLMAVIAGILVDRWWMMAWTPWAYVMAVTVCLLALATRVFLQGTRPSNLARWITVIVAAAAGGFAHHHAHWHWYRADEIGTLIGKDRQTVTVRGVLLSEPRWLAPSEGGSLAARRRPGIYMLLDVRAWERGRERANASGRLALFTSGEWLPLRAGDVIEVKGRLGPIETQRNPREFDFANHFRGQRRRATMYCQSTADIVQVGSEAVFFSRLRSTLRSELDRQIAEYVDSPRANLASAILLGNREQLSNDERDLFLHTGTVHLLAISGLHIGILSGAFYLFLRAISLPRSFCLISVLVLVLLYAWLVEFRPPVTRAAIWISLFCLARLGGAKTFSFNLLSLSGLIVLAINPHDLFHVGPQFSFLAVAALVFITNSRWLQPTADPVRHLIFVTRSWYIRSGLRMRTRIVQTFASCGVLWAITLPLVADRYGVVAPIGLLVNPVVLIPMAAALYGGLIVMLTAAWCPPLAWLGGGICNASLATIEVIIRWGEAVPASHFWTAGPEAWGIGAFYVMLAVWISLPPSFRSWRAMASAAVLLLIASWWIPGFQASWARTRNENLHITFADVGHGTGAILQLPGGKILMYDTGSFGSVQRAGRAASANLWSDRITHIDALVISHADVDHYNGIPTLLERFRIKQIYVSTRMFTSVAPSVRVLFDEIRKHRVPVKLLSEGDVIDLDERVSIDVLSPPAEGLPGNDNVNSIVLRIRVHGRTILLPGDLEGSGLSNLLTAPHEPFDMIMAPHHGSMSSQPMRFANWAKPQVVVISGARGRINPKCVTAYAERGATVLTTGHQGAVRIRISADGLAWQSWLEHGRPHGFRRFHEQQYQRLEFADDSDSDLASTDRFDTGDSAFGDEPAQVDRLGRDTGGHVPRGIDGIEPQKNARRHIGINLPRIIPGVFQTVGNHGPRTIPSGRVRQMDGPMAELFIDCCPMDDQVPCPFVASIRSRSDLGHGRTEIDSNPSICVVAARR